jgi:hypothetical protein
MLSQYITKCKHAFKIIQIIAKLNEIVSHILNMNWLSHLNHNWKVWIIWFHKKHLDKFFIQTNTSVLKKKNLLKNYFHLKDDNNYVGGLCIKIHLYDYQNDKWKLKNYSQNIPKYTKKSTFLLPKATPLNSVFSSKYTFLLYPFLRQEMNLFF